MARYELKKSFRNLYISEMSDLRQAKDPDGVEMLNRISKACRDYLECEENDVVMFDKPEYDYYEKKGLPAFIDIEYVYKNPEEEGCADYVITGTCNGFKMVREFIGDFGGCCSYWFLRKEDLMPFLATTCKSKALRKVSD